MESKRKKMTLEDLAGMVKRGFDRTDEQFASLGARVDEIDQGIRAEMKRAKTDIVAVVNAIRDVKLENLERDVEAIKKKIGMAA